MKKRKKVQLNRLQDSEKDKNLSHAEKVSPDLAERENTSHVKKVVISKVVTEIENHAENSVKEEIREDQENLGGTGSREFRRRKRNKLFQPWALIRSIIH